MCGVLSTRVVVGLGGSNQNQKTHANHTSAAALNTHAHSTRVPQHRARAARRTLHAKVRLVSPSGLAAASALSML